MTTSGDFHGYMVVFEGIAQNCMDMTRLSVLSVKYSLLNDDRKPEQGIGVDVRMLFEYVPGGAA